MSRFGSRKGAVIKIRRHSRDFKQVSRTQERKKMCNLINFFFSFIIILLRVVFSPFRPFIFAVWSLARLSWGSKLSSTYSWKLSTGFLSLINWLLIHRSSEWFMLSTEHLASRLFSFWGILFLSWKFWNFIALISSLTFRFFFFTEKNWRWKLDWLKLEFRYLSYWLWFHFNHATCLIKIMIHEQL